ncbi:MAG: hypothetical protein N3B10_01675 [Armatimonadetes bacterium]|nr:hypothetical protein [Armatimonadota bacterium]MCX7967177.1 hypothetical protein [Armatimonadota bacterium]MDW8144489.1 hypothetical protein [Armatimonadota bacterium]
MNFQSCLLTLAPFNAQLTTLNAQRDLRLMTNLRALNLFGVKISPSEKGDEQKFAGDYGLKPKAWL